MRPISEYLLSNKNKSSCKTGLEQLKENLDTVAVNKEYNEGFYDFCLKLLDKHDELDKLFEYINELINEYKSKINVFIVWSSPALDDSNAKETYELEISFGSYMHTIVFQFWKDLEIIGTKFSNANSRKMFTVNCDFIKTVFELPRSNNGYKYNEYSEPITTANIDTIIDCTSKWIKRGFKI